MPSSNWMLRSASDEVPAGAVSWATSSLVFELFLLPAIVIFYRLSEFRGRCTEMSQDSMLQIGNMP